MRVIFFDDFYNKTVPHAKNTIYSVGYEYVMCVHLVIHTVISRGKNISRLNAQLHGMYVQCKIFTQWIWTDKGK